jgi:hypothetical protein
MPVSILLTPFSGAFSLLQTAYNAHSIQMAGRTQQTDSLLNTRHEIWFRRIVKEIFEQRQFWLQSGKPNG